MLLMEETFEILHPWILETYLVPRVCLDLRKSKICIIWIHTSNFFPGWCPKDLQYETLELQLEMITRTALLSCHTLIISTSCPTAFSPGNNGWYSLKSIIRIRYRVTKLWKSNKIKTTIEQVPTWPKSSSAKTQPADHMSIEVVYSVAPKISSGAR